MRSISASASSCKVAAAFVAMALACAAAIAEPAFSGLGPEESAALDAGKAVIRSVRDSKSLSLAVSGKEADELRARIASLRPNYLSEVMAAAPAPDAAAVAALFGRLAAALADTPGYAGIPYYSKANKRYYDLFDKSQLVSRKAQADGEILEVKQHMEPFDEYVARYEYRLEGGRLAPSALAFTGTNLEPIVYSYRNFKAVAAGGMVWSLYAFRSGDRVLFYGVGAVKAFDLFGAFRGKLETSFTGRIESFFDYMSKSMRG